MTLVTVWSFCDIGDCVEFCDIGDELRDFIVSAFVSC